MGDSSPDRYFSGFIDEVRIYNRSLPQSEIDDLFMPPMTIETLTTNSTKPTINGTVLGVNSIITVTISGTSYNYTYPANNDGNYKRSLNGASITTGLSPGTYDIIVNQTIPYGYTGAMKFT